MAGTAIYAAVDEGFRRCLDFWSVVLPIFCHYRYVDYVSHPAVPGDAAALAARDAEFNKLHDRYSPIIERNTLRMRGFYLKAAQFLSMRDDFCPEQYLHWVKKLQNEAPCALSGLEARRFIAKELGLPGASEGDVSSVFIDWNDEPVGVASIGQVFKAKLRSTGEVVAVKVQFPGIEPIFRADIRTLKFFTSFALPWAVEPMAAIEKMFASEFDYSLELENMKAIRKCLLPDWGHKIRVPKPFAEFSTTRVLCMEFLEGEKLIDAVRKRLRSMARREGRDPEEYEEEYMQALKTGKIKARSVRVAKLRTMIWRWWRRLRWGDGADDVMDLPGLMESVMNIHGDQVISHGVFNADPHPGNILLLKDGRTLGLIDFGQVIFLPLEFRLSLAKLCIALAERDVAAVARFERECGMVTKYSRDDVRYRSCSFWIDRDTEDVLQGMNLHEFQEWSEREDPLVHFPEDLYLVFRCTFMIRSMSVAFGVRMSTAEYWRPAAEALLKKNGVAI